MINYDPCRLCMDYPKHCRALCVTKMKYLNDVKEDTPVIKLNKKKVFSNEYNKNGIRRKI